MGPASTQGMVQDVVFIATPLASFLIVSISHGAIGLQAVEMSPVDEMPVGKPYEVLVGHDLVAGVPL